MTMMRTVMLNVKLMMSISQYLDSHAGKPAITKSLQRYAGAAHGTAVRCKETSSKCKWMAIHMAFVGPNQAEYAARYITKECE